MKCPICGSDVLSTDSHCNSCGVHLATAFKQKTTPAANPPAANPATPSGKTCPKCGHPVKSTDLTCGNCTHYLGSAPQYAPNNTSTSTPKTRIKDDIFYKIFLLLPIIFAVIVVIVGIALAIEFEKGWIFLVGFPAGGLIWLFFQITLTPIRLQIDYLDAIERKLKKK